MRAVMAAAEAEVAPRFEDLALVEAQVEASAGAVVVVGALGSPEAGLLLGRFRADRLRLPGLPVRRVLRKSYDLCAARVRPIAA
jgi:hypothetical protein